MSANVSIINNSGDYEWKEISGARVKVGLGWRNVSIGYVKVNGEWKEFYVRNKGTVRNFSYETPTANDSVTFNWLAGEDIEKYEFWYRVKNLGATSTPAYQKYTEISSTVVSPPGQKIILSSGSANVSGTGTSFTTQLKPNNIIYTILDSVRVPVGVVKTINSNTSITLVNNWTGLSSDINFGNDFIYQTHNSYTFNTEREKEYNFYLFPVDILNEKGDKSNILTRITPTASPEAITSLVVNGTGKSATFELSWNLSSRYSPTAYKYYDDGASGGPITFKKPFTSNDGKYSTSVAGAGNYRIQIEAFNDLGESSGLSNIVEYKYQPFTYKTLSKPSLTRSIATPSSNWNTVTLTWNNNRDLVDYYELYAKTSGTGTYNLVKTIDTSPSNSSPTLSTTYTGTLQNTTYNFYVKAVGIALPTDVLWNTPPGSTVDSNVVSFRTGQPELTKTTSGNDAYTVNGSTSTRVQTITEKSPDRSRITFSSQPVTTYNSTGRSGKSTSGWSASRYTVTTTNCTITQTRTRRWAFVNRRWQWVYNPWGNTTTSCTPSTRETTNPPSPSYTQGSWVETSWSTRSYTTRQVTVSASEFTREVRYNNTTFDFSASAIKVNAGQSMTSTRLAITASNNGSSSFQIGGPTAGYTTYGFGGSVSFTSNNIYNKLIVPDSRIYVGNNNNFTTDYTNPRVIVSYTYSYTTITQNFGQATLV
jgi:hypothetical protein